MIPGWWRWRWRPREECWAFPQRVFWCTRSCPRGGAQPARSVPRRAFEADDANGARRGKLLCGLRAQFVKGQMEPRLVAVGGIFVQHALGDGPIDGRQGGRQQIARGGCVTGCQGGAESPDHGADAGAVGAVHFGALTSLGRALQDRLFPLFDFGWLSLGHLSLLRVPMQTNKSRGVGEVCQRGVLAVLRPKPAIASCAGRLRLGAKATALGRRSCADTRWARVQYAAEKANGKTPHPDSRRHR